MFGCRRLVGFDDRGLEEVQALGSLDCDSFGAEPIIVKIFAGNDLSIKHAAPKWVG